METNLRPMSLGEILDRTAYLYRSNFLVFAGIFAVYCGVGLFLSLMLIGLGVLLKNLQVSVATISVVTVTCSGIEILVLFLLLGAAIAAISRAVAWVHLGQPATIRGAYASILPRLRRYLGLMTVTALVVYTPLLILYSAYFGWMFYKIKGFGTPAGITAAQNMSPETSIYFLVATLIFIILIVPVAVYTILMSLRYSLALPACVVEGLKAFSSLRRSVQLSKGSRGRIFILGLLIGAIKIGFTMIAQVFFIVAAFKNHGQLSPGMNAISQVIAYVTNTFLGPIYATGITLFYFDQRVRKEGFDIEWMMQAAGLTMPASGLTAEPPPQPPSPVGADPMKGTVELA
jgi:hypothetical protein